MSIERFALESLMINLPLLAIAARYAGVFDRRRLCIAALAATAYGVLAAAAPSPWRAPPAQIALLAALGRLIAGRDRRPLALCAMAALVGGSAFMAGWLQLLSSRGPLPELSGLALLSATARLCRRRSARWEAEICLVSGSRQARFTALIDTGNRLREPLSGNPVMIVEAALVADMLSLPVRRWVPYDAIGGCGTLPCFRPDAAWVLRGHRRLCAPEVWVAVSPVPLPGSYRALAPCEFASLSL